MKLTGKFKIGGRLLKFKSDDAAKSAGLEAGEWYLLAPQNDYDDTPYTPKQVQ